MTEYERTTTRETTATGAATPTTAGTVPDPVAASTVRTTERAYEPSGPSGLAVVARIVTFLFGILQVALILRIVLLVLDANVGNDVVAFLLNVTAPFVEPFRGMFALDSVSADQGSVLDIAAIVALIAWTLIEMLVLAALRIFSRRPSEVA